MCPYYDEASGHCRITDVSHRGDRDCQDSEYWKRCPNAKK